MSFKRNLKFLIKLSILLAWLIPLNVGAEYRAFLLQLKSSESETPTQVKSYLDPEQYRSYYHVKPETIISYTETWMCPPREESASLYKRTVGFDPICKSPKEIAADKVQSTAQSPERQPASK